MPLILLCGHPSSGKTYRARQIVSYLEKKLVDPNEDSPTNGLASNVQSTVKELSELNLRESSTTQNASASPTEQSSDTTQTNNPSQILSTTSATTTTKSTMSPQTSSRPTKSALTTRKIHYISDHTLEIPRSSYLTAKHEKDARGALYSAVKRALGRNDITILDSGNYIKGWRYQLYCEAKNIGTASCVVHVGVAADQCRELNDSRLKQLHHATNDLSSSDDNQDNAGPSQHTLNGSAEQDPYSKPAFEELLMRFEEPNPMTRWDTPLYTVPYDDPTPPLDQIWNEIIQGIGKDGKTKVIRPNQAAVLTPATSPSHLYNLERTTQGVISAIQAHQQTQGGSAEGDTISVPAGPAQEQDAESGKKLEVTLPATPLTFAHLQRLKRQFIALHRQQMGGLGMGGVGGGHGAAGMGLSPERVAELFVGFLGERFAE